MNDSAQYKEQLYKLRHSASHVMAQAVLKLFPKAKLAIGPAIDDGFYYDFQLPRQLTPEDLVEIEKEMREIIAKDLPIRQVFKKREDALAFYKTLKQKFKLELLEGIPDKDVSFYITGENEFVDLCIGPHVESTSQIGVIKLMSIAGAYWHGDEKQPMLQRVYGTAFPTQAELDEFLANIEKAKERDHRKLNVNMDLFMTDDKVGAGLILWKPRGAYMRHQIMTFAFDTYLQRGYDPVATPHMASLDLWKTSGHWNFYRESMYDAFGVEGQQYTLKPMNCPFHISIYQSTVRSYRELPIRYTEMGTVYRFERSGTLQGLFRVRGFTQDDAHIFCREDQLATELDQALELTFYILKTFGMDNFEITISSYDPANKKKYLGDLSVWDWAVDTLVNTVKRHNVPYEVVPGEAAFYGPKIDMLFTDSMKRKHQLSTLQLDFNLPERFDMTYMGKDGKEHRPFMIHRALLGSLERFIATLVEHYGGDVPLWLQKEKVRMIPVSAKHLGFMEKVQERFTAAGLESYLDTKDEPMGGKIKQAELEKIPYIVVAGDKEADLDSLSVRVRHYGNIGLVKIDELIAKMKQEITEKATKSVLTQGS